MEESSQIVEFYREMLSLGSSKPWPDAMEVLTGERKMNADAILEYFKPLHDWLVEENKFLGAHVGWTATDSKCEFEILRLLVSLITCFFYRMRRTEARFYALIELINFCSLC